MEQQRIDGARILILDDEAAGERGAMQLLGLLRRRGAAVADMRASVGQFIARAELLASPMTAFTVFLFDFSLRGEYGGIAAAQLCAAHTNPLMRSAYRISYSGHDAAIIRQHGGEAVYQQIVSKGDLTGLLAAIAAARQP